MMENKVVILGAIMCLTAIEIVALLKGYNGWMFGIVTTAIGGLAGWVLPSPAKK